MQPIFFNCWPSLDTTDTFKSTTVWLLNKHANILHKIFINQNQWLLKEHHNHVRYIREGDWRGINKQTASLINQGDKTCLL